MTTKRTSSPAPVFDSRGGTINLYMRKGGVDMAAYLLEVLEVRDHSNNATPSALFYYLMTEKIKELKGNEDE